MSDYGPGSAVFAAQQAEMYPASPAYANQTVIPVPSEDSVPAPQTHPGSPGSWSYSQGAWRYVPQIGPQYDMYTPYIKSLLAQSPTPTDPSQVLISQMATAKPQQPDFWQGLSNGLQQLLVQLFSKQS